MPDDWQIGSVGRGGLITAAAAAVSRLSDVRRCGATDGNGVAHGDWNWAPHGRFDPGNFRAVQGSYNYRLTPGEVWRLHGYVQYDPPRGRILYTKPDRWVEDGEPWFKTQKQLGERAIMADAFHKRGNQYSYQPGLGFFGHRDGYNVLYGDGHAAWFGDPQQSYIWYELPSRSGANAQFCLAGNSCVSDYATTGSCKGTAYTTPTIRYGNVLQWHILDAASGVDKGVDGQ
ncbi:MAG TPA: hypothetical protein P5137_11055, partial [Candidatus Brocadiia bacterium]|nr:hypothetical protein [Candidatus Brocadiia bacterium]